MTGEALPPLISRHWYADTLWTFRPSEELYARQGRRNGPFHLNTPLAPLINPIKHSPAGPTTTKTPVERGDKLGSFWSAGALQRLDETAVGRLSACE